MSKSWETDAWGEEKLASPEFLAKLELLQQMVKRMLRHRFAVSRTGRGEKSLEFLEYRRYRPGDDLKRLDINVYRRLGEPVVREYVREVPSHWLVALDCSRSMGLYGKWDFARRIAAALLYTGASTAGRVWLYLFPGPRFTCYHKKSGVRAALAALDDLQTTATPGEEDCKFLSRLPPYTTAMVISDFYGPICRDFFTSLKWNNMRGIALHLLAREEKRPELKGMVSLEDAETGTRRDACVTSALIAEYERHFSRHVHEVKYFCRQHRVVYQEIAPENSLSKTALKVLKAAGLLR